MAHLPHGPGTDLLGVAARLGPSLAARSLVIESNRTLPDDVVADLRDAGLFRLYVPSELGGPELHAQTGLDVFEELAYHDGAAAWCVMIAATTSLLAAYLPEPHATDIYADASSITGGFAAPVGRARAVEAGLSVSGQWQWGSGTRHCTAIGGGCLLVDESGRPAPRIDGLAAPFVFLDTHDVELLDTWFVTGLKGTGSTDYRAESAFVPEGRWVELGTARPQRGGALYRMPFFGLLAAGVAAVSLGLGRRALAELVELTATKRPAGSSRPLAERAPIQADVARIDAIVSSCRTLLADAVGTAWDEVASNETPSLAARTQLRLAATHCTQEVARAVAMAYGAAGGAAVYETSPIQRVFRDAHVATQHAIVASRTYELVGRIRLGLETDERQL